MSSSSKRTLTPSRGSLERIDGDKDGEGEKSGKPKARKPDKSSNTGTRLINTGGNFVTTAILLYFAYAAKNFHSMIYPVFPEFDANHNYIQKYGNTVRNGASLKVKMWVANTAFPVKEAPIAEFDITYEYDDFEPVERNVAVNVSEAMMRKGKNKILSAEVYSGTSRIARAKGNMLKAKKLPEVRPKFKLLSGEQCPEPPPALFGKEKVALGIPWMQVRLVHDQTMYPPPWVQSHYNPQLFVDEFWMTDDQLLQLNASGSNSFESKIHFGLMSAARWRFQRQMEFSLQQNAKVFGEESEEMLQIRDLFANTNSYLLITTMVVSVLHIIFEFLAFKNDVLFFRSCDSEQLNQYVSIQSIALGVVFQVVLLLYLWDESANIIVLLTSLVAIVIDLWKVQRAMRLTWKKRFGFLLLPALEAKTVREKRDDFDSIAMRYLALFLSPAIIGYAIYTLVSDCHRGWYSYLLTAASSCVYSLGFVLMTPQVFINYKNKSVAYLPWRRFVYRAITTFIDDLFAFIIRMPTMHRMSCFRDDVVFFIYLYQRWIYPVDKNRTFDEDGYDLTDAPGGDTDAADASESRKDR